MKYVKLLLWSIKGSTWEKLTDEFSLQAKILFFPEGTRGDGDSLLPFKKGSFHVAIEAQGYIQPVVISKYHFLNSKAKLFNRGLCYIYQTSPCKYDFNTVYSFQVRTSLKFCRKSPASDWRKTICPNWWTEFREWCNPSTKLSVMNRWRLIISARAFEFHRQWYKHKLKKNAQKAC